MASHARTAYKVSVENEEQVAADTVLFGTGESPYGARGRAGLAVEGESSPTPQCVPAERASSLLATSPRPTTNPQGAT